MIISYRYFFRFICKTKKLRISCKNIKESPWWPWCILLLLEPLRLHRVVCCQDTQLTCREVLHQTRPTWRNGKISCSQTKQFMHTQTSGKYKYDTFLVSMRMAPGNTDCLVLWSNHADYTCFFIGLFANSHYITFKPRISCSMYSHLASSRSTRENRCKRTWSSLWSSTRSISPSGQPIINLYSIYGYPTTNLSLLLQVTPRCSATCLASEIGINGSSKECHCRRKPAAQPWWHATVSACIQCFRIFSTTATAYYVCTCTIRVSKKQPVKATQLQVHWY